MLDPDPKGGEANQVRGDCVGVMPEPRTPSGVLDSEENLKWAYS